LVLATDGTTSKLTFTNTKVRSSKMAHLKAGPPFSYISLSENIFRSFFKQRKIDEESNTSGFIFLKHY